MLTPVFVWVLGDAETEKMFKNFVRGKAYIKGKRERAGKAGENMRPRCKLTPSEGEGRVG